MILGKIHKRLAYILRCNKAATAIEFAIVAPALFLLLIGIIELGLVFFTYSVLEGATDIGSRIGKTGYYQGTGNNARINYIEQRIETLSGGFLDPSKLQFFITSYSTFDQISETGEGTLGDAGAGGAVVVYRVVYPWSLFTPIMRQLLGDANGNINITAVATVRNEPF